MSYEDQECQHYRNCGSYCETEEERDQCLCCDCLEAEQQQDVDDAALAAVRAAVSGYYAALDRREHGGVAQDNAFSAIERALGMRWIQGAALKTPNAQVTGDSPAFCNCGRCINPRRLTDRQGGTLHGDGS